MDRSIADERREGELVRVVILSPSSELGGAERSLCAYLEVAHGRTIEATVLLSRRGPLCDLLSNAGIPWEVAAQPGALLCQSRRMRAASLVRFPELLYRGPLYLLRLAATIRRASPQVIYTNGIKSHVSAVLLRPLVRARLVWHVRDHWAGRLLGRLADCGPQRVIANSQATADVLKKSMKSPHKVTVVHNAVDARKFSPDGPTRGAGLGLARIGLVASLSRLKGHELVLRAAPRILAEFPSAQFFFIGGAIYDTVGDRGYERELRRRIDEAGLGGCVTITGFQRDMPPWYRGMDVVVNASIHPEGFGRTVLEAMACARAVVAPNAGGVPEFVRHRENGLLYEMGDSEGLADAVLTLLRQPELRRDLGAAGRETVLQRFGLAPYARAISHILHEATRARL